VVSEFALEIHSKYIEVLSHLSRKLNNEKHTYWKGGMEIEDNRKPH
jgi:hypothetical protein